MPLHGQHHDFFLEENPSYIHILLQAPETPFIYLFILIQLRITYEKAMPLLQSDTYLIHHVPGSALGSRNGRQVMQGYCP